VSLIVLRSDSGGLSSVSPNAVGVIDPHTNRLAAEVPVGIAPESIASGAGAVWAANVEDRTVSRIDPGTRTVVRNIPVDGLPSDVAFGGGIVWVALGALAELTRINPEQNEAARSIAALGKGAACGAPDASVTFGAGSAWFACEFADLGRVEPRTGEAMRVGYEAGLLTSTSAVLPEFADIAFGLGSLWLVNRAANSVIEVDPTTIRRLRDITVGRKPSALAIGANAVWVANADDDTVTRIAIPGRGQAPTLTHIPVGDGPVDVAVGEGGVWVANQLGRSVSRIDPKTGDVVATIDVGNQPQGIAAADGAVWVTVGSSSQSS
jgi:YVTN family beta-propeller protein